MATKKATKKKTKTTVTRSAVTGHFVRTTTVDRHPDKTVTETVTKPKPKSKKKSTGG